MNKRLLHFFLDEKAVTRAIQLFDKVFPGENRFIVVIDKSETTTTYVKINHPDLTIAKYNSNEFNTAIGDLSQYEYILIHFLTFDIIDYILGHPHPGYCWGVWGADLYNQFLEHMGYHCYYDREEALSFMGRNAFVNKMMYPIRSLFTKIRIRRQRKAIRMISYVGAIKGDFDLLLEYCPEMTHLKRIYWELYPIDSMVDINLLEKPLGNDIVLGNSAFPACNHVEIFKELSKIDLKGRKVIVPLSYGNIAPYIINKGKEFLGENFVPITNFLPLNDYNQLMHGACTYIYNSYRQMAAGNIAVALFLGATVFLNERSTLVNHFRDNLGCIIFSITDLSNMIDYRLTEEEKTNNRKAILKGYSEEMVFSYIRQYFSK